MSSGKIFGHHTRRSRLHSQNIFPEFAQVSLLAGCSVSSSHARIRNICARPSILYSGSEEGTSFVAGMHEFSVNSKDLYRLVHLRFHGGFQQF